MSNEIKITIGFNEETSCLIRDLISQFQNSQQLAGLSEINRKLDKALKKLGEIKIMNQQTIQLLNDIDAASTELATDIQALLDRAESAGSLTAEEINTALAPKVEFLKALASNTNAPIPPVPPPTEG